MFTFQRGNTREKQREWIRIIKRDIRAHNRETRKQQREVKKLIRQVKIDSLRLDLEFTSTTTICLDSCNFYKAIDDKISLQSQEIVYGYIRSELASTDSIIPTSICHLIVIITFMNDIEEKAIINENKSLTKIYAKQFRQLNKSIENYYRKIAQMNSLVLLLKESQATLKGQNNYGRRRIANALFNLRDVPNIAKITKEMGFNNDDYMFCNDIIDYDYEIYDSSEDDIGLQCTNLKDLYLYMAEDTEEKSS